MQGDSSLREGQKVQWQRERQKQRKKRENE